MLFSGILSDNVGKLLCLFFEAQNPTPGPDIRRGDFWFSGPGRGFWIWGCNWHTCRHDIICEHNPSPGNSGYPVGFSGRIMTILIILPSPPPSSLYWWWWCEHGRRTGEGGGGRRSPGWASQGRLPWSFGYPNDIKRKNGKVCPEGGAKIMPGLGGNFL